MKKDVLFAVRKMKWRFVSKLAFVALVWLTASLSAAVPALSKTSDTSLSCEQIVRLANWGVLNSRHAGSVKLDDKAFARKALERFTEKADPQRLLLTHSEVSEFRLEGLKAWDVFLTSRDCSYFEKWITSKYPVVRQKFAARAETIAKKAATLRLAAKKETSPKPKAYTRFAKTEAELQERLLTWAKEILASANADLLRAYHDDKAALVRDTVFQGLFDGHSPSRNWLAKAVLEALDPYSTYFSPSEFEDFYSDLSGGTSGVGLRIRKVPQGFLVEKILNDSPASKAKHLKEGDVIVKVNGQLTSEMNQLDARKALQGPEGSVVKLEVVSAGDSSRYTESLRRKRIRFDESRLTYMTKKTPGGKRIAVIELPSFYGRGGMDDTADERSTTEDFKAILRRIQKSPEKPSALVLDLRGNPGGYLEEAVSLAGVFVGTRPVVGVVEKDGKRILKESHLDSTYSGPLAVLVDGNTASASEVFAGALKDYQRALVLSETSTFGKGSVQRLFHLDDPFLHPGFGAVLGRGVVKLTTSVFYSPLGFTPANGGITPHLTLPAMNPATPDPADAAERATEALPEGEPLISGQELAQTRAKQTLMAALVHDLRGRLEVHAKAQKKAKEELEDADLSLTLTLLEDYLALAKDTPLLNATDGNLVRK